MKALKLSLVVILTMLCVQVLATPAFAGPATEFVKAKTGPDLAKLIKQPPSPKRTKTLQQQLRGLIDFEELSRRALGKHWEARTQKEQQTFITLLEDICAINYANQFQKQASDYNVDYLGEKGREGTGLVNVETRLTANKTAVIIVYKLLKRDNAKGGYIIYDMMYDENASLVETYRDSYVPLIKKKGWDGMIQQLQVKLKTLRSARK